MDSKASTLSTAAAALVVVLAILLLVGPFLYVASVGPVIWLADRNYINGDQGTAVHAIYSPLEYAIRNCEPLEVVVEWYVSFFRRSRPGPISY